MKIHQSRNLYTSRFDVETASNLWQTLRRVSSRCPLTAALGLSFDLFHWLHYKSLTVCKYVENFYQTSFKEKKLTILVKYVHEKGMIISAQAHNITKAHHYSPISLTKTSNIVRILSQGFGGKSPSNTITFPNSGNTHNLTLWDL